MGRIIFNVALAALILGAGARGTTGSAAPEPSGMRGSTGRVSVVEGKFLVKGPTDQDWSYVQKNGAVYDEDSVWADDNSFVEIELERGAWLRLGPDTRLDLRRLPPDGDLRLTRGSLDVDLSDRARAGVVIDTVPGRVEVGPGALARIDVRRNEEVRVLDRRGRVIGRLRSGGEVQARAGEMFVMIPGSGQARNRAFDRRELDAFDDWADRRVAYYLDGRLPRGVKDYIPGIYDLEDYGQWVNYNGDRYWRPIGLTDAWRPYSDGYWASWQGQPYWIPQEPWGYTTSHYGRWAHSPGMGWLWRPDTTWGPAWVQWATGGQGVFWAPLGINDQPVNRYRPQSLGGALMDALVWSFMPQSNFMMRQPGLILPLSSAPSVYVTKVRVVKDPSVIASELPREFRLRGQRLAEPQGLAADERMRALQRHPARDNFRITAGPQPAAGTEVSARERNREGRRGGREGALARVRGTGAQENVAVPEVRIREDTARPDREPGRRERVLGTRERAGTPGTEQEPVRERTVIPGRDRERPGTPGDRDRGEPERPRTRREEPPRERPATPGTPVPGRVNPPGTGQGPGPGEGTRAGDEGKASREEGSRRDADKRKGKDKDKDKDKGNG